MFEFSKEGENGMSKHELYIKTIGWVFSVSIFVYKLMGLSSNEQPGNFDDDFRGRFFYTKK